ncbi:hypothetical protein DFJ73DRAFT_144986 [Zopfochytrium polystomum]|nr:hypothetical protein DFJ73DRAFT_144986 [Zopfochytrium polystomum]
MFDHHFVQTFPSPFPALFSSLFNSAPFFFVASSPNRFFFFFFFFLLFSSPYFSSLSLIRLPFPLKTSPVQKKRHWVAGKHRRPTYLFLIKIFHYSEKHNQADASIQSKAASSHSPSVCLRSHVF